MEFGDLFLGAVAGGFVTVLFERTFAAPAQIRLHNRCIRERDASLRKWVSDEDVRLGRELNGITNEMAARGHLYAGALPNALSAARELALRRWRDERERVTREVGAMYDAESLAHRLMRDAWAPMPTLTALDDPAVLATIARWREDVQHLGGGSTPVRDPSAE
jgi:hypothetical protein